MLHFRALLHGRRPPDLAMLGQAIPVLQFAPCRRDQIGDGQGPLLSEALPGRPGVDAHGSLDRIRVSLRESRSYLYSFEPL
jgi:hypothetical protein